MNEGQNLWNAVELVIRAGKEISAMKAELSEKMNKRLESAGSKLNLISVPGNDSEVHSQDKWVCIDWLSQWGLKPKGKGQKVCGNLSMQIVLWTEDDDSATCGKIPRVEVGYYGYSEEKIDANYCEAGTFLTQEVWKEMFPKTDSSYACWPKLVKPCEGVSWNEKANWAFAIPLFSVNNNEDIDHLIINPTMKLLSGSTPEVALKDVPTIGFSIGKEGVLFSMPA